MPPARLRLFVVLGLLLAAASIAVPMSWGIQFRISGLTQAAAGAALLVCCSALALNGSRAIPMPTRRLLPAVLATTAANAVTPAGIGGTLVVLRIHRRSGLTTEQATAAAALRTGAGVLTATAVTTVVASTIGMSELPSGGTTMRIAAVVLAAVALLALAMPITRRRFLTEAVAISAAVWDVVRRPRCCASLLVGCLGVTLAQLLTLQGAVHAVGGHVPWADLLVALLGSAAARSALPLPGGVGPVEAALVGGLTAFGLHWEAAATAVAVYRTAGHWLPVLAGVLSLRALRHRQLI